MEAGRAFYWPASLLIRTHPNAPGVLTCQPRSGAFRLRPKPGARALVAQLDRASDFDSEGRRFESFRARHGLPLRPRPGSGETLFRTGRKTLETNASLC